MRKGLDIKDQLVPECVPYQRLEGNQCEQYTLIVIRNQPIKTLHPEINGWAEKYNPLVNRPFIPVSPRASISTGAVHKVLSTTHLLRSDCTIWGTALHRWI